MLCGSSYVKLFTKLKFPVHVKPQLRILASHTDLKVPDFEFYRRESGKLACGRQKVKENHFVRRAFTYGVTAAWIIGAAYAGKMTAQGLVLSMSASADVLALAQIEVDLSQIPEGTNATFKWRGKPLFILHRTAADVERERAVDITTLRDPATDEERCQRPEWLIVLGVCTHLGCVPIPHLGDFGGYYCPCHGSHFDAAGRARKGPAPLNLHVPPHRFEENIVFVG